MPPVTVVTPAAFNPSARAVSGVAWWSWNRGRSDRNVMYSGLARAGSPDPTSQRVPTAPSWGPASDSTLVSYRKSGPRAARAAVATRIFWVEAGMSDWSGRRSRTGRSPS